MELIRGEANGSIGALRVFCDNFINHFKHDKLDPTAPKALYDYFFSYDLLKDFSRCFIVVDIDVLKDDEGIDDFLLEFLIKGTAKRDDSLEEKFIRSGILTLKDDMLSFTSPLAKRFFHYHFFKNRRSDTLLDLAK